MSQKRSYLESLNAGRERRHSTSIERLNRTLEELEGRIDRMPRDSERGYGDRAPDRYRERPSTPDYYQGLASDMHRVRAHEQDLAYVSQIASELQRLREELRDQMGTGIGHEFAALRRDIERAGTSDNNDQAATLSSELERLSSMIEELAQRGDDRGVHLLRQEIEEMKSALEKLAREDTVRSVGERWEELDRRWDALANDLRTASAGDPGREAFETRLDQIEKAVRSLPESLSLRTLEDKLLTLASVVDHLSSQQDRFGPDALETIERRLDELSRAVVASTSARQGQHFDPEPLERIEARIGALARQIEEITAGQAPDVSGQIDTITQRVEQLAHRVESPNTMVEQLARQIAVISEKLDTVPGPPDMEPVLRDMEDRFTAISAKLDQRHDDAMEQGQALFRELEQRIEQIAGQSVQPEDGGQGAELVEMMERRFAEIAERLDRRAEVQDGTALGQMEQRLEEIARRLESSSASSLDPELIRSLQSQVASLSDHIMKPERPLPDFEDLGPRLDHIEQSIAESREKLMEAARQAAEEAVRALNESQDAAFVSELSQELRSLESMTRASDERNAKTFEAIHDTLIKIVDRLGSMEKRQSQSAQARDTIESPSIAPEIGDPEKGSAPVSPPPQRSPVEAASAAARAAVEDEDLQEKSTTQPSRSLLGGITRALKGGRNRKDKAEAGAEVKEPEANVDFDEPLDPKLANQPLEPGSGAPDLNAIMRRVRDQRDDPGIRSSDTAKSDFIAAARRAAQAAAAEAEATKARPAAKQPARGGLARFLPGGRNMAMIGLAVLILALGALQLGRSFLPQGQDGASVEPAVAADEVASIPRTEVETAPAVDTETDQAGTTALQEDSPAPVIAEAKPLPRQVDAQPATFAPIDPRPTGFDTSAFPETDFTGFVDETDTAAIAEEEILPEPLVAVPAEAGPAALREAAEKGDALALFEIGDRYAEGRGVGADMEKAAEWYEMAAEMGLAVAQYRIGGLYEKGIGVDRDVSLAETWYTRAAEQGNAGAMHNLGVLLAMGATGATDNEAAARWFLEAAEFGIVDSQFNMGILSAKGIGMEQDLEEGYKWFALVAETGDQDAAAKRDEVAGLLSPEQLERAKAAAKLWRARVPDAKSNTVEIPQGWTESNETTSGIGMREAVAEVQRILNAKGYEAGPVDGVMGQMTRSAIMAFQRDNGLEADGAIGQDVVRLLLERG